MPHIAQHLEWKSAVAAMMCMTACTAVELNANRSEATWHRVNLFKIWVSSQVCYGDSIAHEAHAFSESISLVLAGDCHRISTVLTIVCLPSVQVWSMTTLASLNALPCMLQDAATGCVYVSS